MADYIHTTEDAACNRGKEVSVDLRSSILSCNDSLRNKKD